MMKIPKQEYTPDLGGLSLWVGLEDAQNDVIEKAVEYFEAVDSTDSPVL